MSEEEYARLESGEPMSPFDDMFGDGDGVETSANARAERAACEAVANQVRRFEAHFNVSPLSQCSCCAWFVRLSINSLFYLLRVVVV
jgi:hypothetical protein